LLPKLLGSYESELHPFIEEMLGNDHTTIVDIGCAEGYYAVGFGLRFAKADVYAFDVDLRARKLCAQLAELNALTDRIHIDGFCDTATLKSIPLGRKALFVSDCEGYEKMLFTPELASVLGAHDLIIETHDFIDLQISRNIRDAFRNTHRIRSVKSTDDIEKAHHYRYAQLENYDLQTRRLAFAERRPAIMEWLVMTPK
jgi:precorrin-6B methylase 2